MDLQDLLGLPELGAELSEELCVNDDHALSFDNSEYLTLNEFSCRLKELISARNGKGLYRYAVPISALRVNGSVKNEPMDRYLAVDAINSSLVKEVLVSPRHYFIAKNTPIEPRDPSHFDLGTFAHSAILEPSKFNKIHAEPKATKSTTEGCIKLIKFYNKFAQLPMPNVNTMKIAALREEIAQLQGFCDDRGHSFIGDYDNMIVQLMRAAITTYGGGIIPKLMYYAKKELSMYGNDPSTGLPIKIRPDAILLEEDFGANVIVSVKTTSAEDPPAFDRDCAKFKYEVAEGMYLDLASHITGRKFSATLMIVLQTVAPYQVFIKWWNAEDLQIGKYKYYNAMETIRECAETDNYPGFEVLAEEGNFGIIESRLPSYIKLELPPQYVEG